MSPKKPTKPPFSKPFKKFLLISMASLLISMASFLFLTLLSLLLFFSHSSATTRHQRRPSPTPSLAGIPPELHQACKATRYPDTCESTIQKSDHLGQNPNTTQIIDSAIFVTSQGVKTAQSMVQRILDSSTANPNRSTAAKNCLEALKNCDYRLSSTVAALTRGRIKDARAWMSAALAYNYDTWSALKYVNDTKLVNETMSFMDSLIGLNSNALSMLMAYDIFGFDSGSWAPPRTERDGFWEGVAGSGGGSGSGFKGGIPPNMAVDATVCKGGKCDYATVQAAVEAAPANLGTKRFVIRIKEGVYEEIVRVPLEKKNLVFLGDGMGKTVITGSLNVGQPGLSTYNTATVGVLGDGFMASYLTIENTAGPDAHQAVAFRSDSDLSVIENCEFLGNQDTLYAHSLRQFYKSCRIEGNVDFIFGNSAAIFQDCLILVRPRQLNPEKGENNAITAHGRTDPAQSTGLIFQNCVINGTDKYMALYYSKPSVHKNFLGRPWKEFSRTVFINCLLEALITPQGWMPWSGDFALKTLYYGEFENSGPGSNTSGRVSWSSQVPAEHVYAYSVQNFIQGNEWIPTSS